MFSRPQQVTVLTLLLLSGCSGDKDVVDTQDTSQEEEEVNVAPVAVDDAASVISSQSVTIDVTDNDDDPNQGDNLFVSAIVQPANGIVEIENDDDVTYTSLNDYVGIDSFTYTVADEGGLTDEANVTINVQEVPTLVITAPEEASTVTGPDIVVSFEVVGCDVTSPGADENGCHVHKYLNGEQYTDSDGSGFGHYTPESFTISPLEAGTHEFELVLVKNDGSDEAFQPQIDDSVTFLVEDPTGDTGLPD